MAAEHNAGSGKDALVDDGFEQEMAKLEARALAHRDIKEPAESEDSQNSAVR